MSLSTPVLPHPRTPILIAGVVFALTLTRWLVPTEGAAEGDTLWIAGLWFAATAMVAWFAGTAETRRRFDFADLAVVLLISGHVLSGLMVIFGGGDRRVALNLTWEWLSLGVFWLAWRELLRVPAVRRVMTPLLLTTAVTISVWGLWQYFVWYPAMQAKLGPLFDQIHAGGAEAAKARQQLQEAGVPVEGAALRLFENRLRQSREPFGPFALANTLGGLLGAWLVVAISDALQKRSAATRGGSWIVLLLSVPIAVCLYLTNSRTAWVGTIAAGCAAAAVWLAKRVPALRTRQAIFPAASVLGVILAAGVFFVISRDEHQVPGPLKSLAYRAEYWAGTWRLLRTAPLRGPGLGQFRDKYLAFKVPESSEEIADPHNLLLDVWSNGGAIGVLGLLGLVAITWQRLRQRSTEQLSPQSPPTASAGSTPWLLPGLASYALTIFGQWLVTGVWDEHSDRVAMFAVVWFATACGVTYAGRMEFGDNGSIAWFAVIALLVHLLGAGGIAMPAVTQLLLLLIAWGLAGEEQTVTTAGNRAPFRLLAGLGIVLCAACCWSSVFPVAQAKRAIAAGDAAWLMRGDANRAEQAFRRAAEADTWSKDPWERLAELSFSQAIGTRSEVDRTEFEAAIRADDEAITRAPDRIAVRLRQAEMWLRAAQRTRSPDDWQAAVAAYRNLEPRYPTNAQLHAEYAVALSHAGDHAQAAAQAQATLNQDDLNHRRGHTDRYLSESLRRELEAIAKDAQGHAH